MILINVLHLQNKLKNQIELSYVPLLKENIILNFKFFDLIVSCWSTTVVAWFRRFKFRPFDVKTNSKTQFILNIFLIIQQFIFYVYFFKTKTQSKASPIDEKPTNALPFAVNLKKTSNNDENAVKNVPPSENRPNFRLPARNVGRTGAMLPVGRRRGRGGR